VNLNIIQYRPGERKKWIAIEDSIVHRLKTKHSQHNSWEVAVKETERELRIIKSKILPEDYGKLDYHAEQAGKRFLDQIGEPGGNSGGLIRVV